MNLKKFAPIQSVHALSIWVRTTNARKAISMKQNKFTKSARGQDCTLQIMGVCNHNPETVVLCHIPDESGTGKMGGKSSDWCAVFGCSACHDAIDGRDPKAWNYVYQDKDWYIMRALKRTWRKWIEMELIKI